MRKQKSLQQLAIEYINDQNEQTFNVITKRLTPGLRKYLSKYTSDFDKIDFIITDTFMKIWTKIDKYNTKWQFSTWVYSMAKNKMIIELQKDNKTNSKFLDDLNMKENLDISTNKFNTEVSENYSYENVVRTLFDVSLNIIEKFDEPMRTIVKEMKVNNVRNKDLQKIVNTSSCNISIIAKKGLIKLNSELKKQYPIQYKLYENYLQNGL